MHANNGGVDHLDSRNMGSRECVYNTAPDTGPPPANKAVVASSVGAKPLREIAPRCPRSQDPEDAIEHTTVVYPRNATRLVGQHRLDGSPLAVGEFVAHDSKFPVWEFESQDSGHPQCGFRLSPFLARLLFGAKRTSTGRHNWLNRGGACCGLACAGEALGPPRRTQARGGCLMSSQFLYRRVQAF